MAVVREQMGLGILILLILCAQIGGLGTVFGPVLGALLVVFIMTGVRWYLPLFPGMNVVIYSFGLMMAILFLPNGAIALFKRRGAKEPKAVLTEAGGERVAAAFSPGFLASQEQETSSPLLKIEGASKNFGGLMAVDNFSLNVNSGEIVGLIGPNGAGKTTAFNIITGFYEPVAGEITFNGRRLNGMRPDQTCRLGLVRTFQIAHPFSTLTAVENVMLGAFVHYNKTSVAREKAMHILRVTGMADKADVPAKDLTLALQRRLEIARVLATEPRLILLDESMAGLTPTEMKEGIELIRNLRKGGITFLIVEHVMPIIMNLAERIVVMHLGQKMAEGTPEEVVKNKQVIEAYLGEEAFIA
jgi:ABC-type branched-subunit amino acid transport system ATPase component